MKDVLRNAVFFVYNCFAFIQKKITDIIDYKKKELLNKRFKHIGKDSIINRAASITNPQYISIGDNFCSLHNLRIDAIDEYKGFKFNPSITIGNNVSLNSDCHLGAINSITIGNDVLIGSRVLIIDHSHGEINEMALQTIPMLRDLYSKGPIVIEDNVWIGEGVCILPGVKVGKNAILGANSVVNKDVPTNSVVGGNPAKVIKVLS